MLQWVLKRRGCAPSNLYWEAKTMIKPNFLSGSETNFKWTTKDFCKWSAKKFVRDRHWRHAQIFWQFVKHVNNLMIVIWNSLIQEFMYNLYCTTCTMLFPFREFCIWWWTIRGNRYKQLFQLLLMFFILSVTGSMQSPVQLSVLHICLFYRIWNEMLQWVIVKIYIARIIFRSRHIPFFLW